MMRGRAITTLALTCWVAACAPVPRPRSGVFHDSDADVAVTRIAHGSVVVALHGSRFVIDPWFHSGILHRQSEPLGLRPEAIPPAAAIVLTQGGADHFDEEALAELARRVPRVVAPARLRGRLLTLGFIDVRSLVPWERTRVDGVELTAVPSSDGERQLGFVLTSQGVRVYIAGETGRFAELRAVADAFPRPDLALVPIGGPRTVGLARGMGPEDAAAAVALLDPAVVIPTHYGRQDLVPFFWQAGEPVTRFRAALDRRGLGDRLVVLDPGESWHRLRSP